MTKRTEKMLNEMETLMGREYRVGKACGYDREKLVNNLRKKADDFRTYASICMSLDKIGGDSYVEFCKYSAHIEFKYTDMANDN